jgi:hypothetical protein
MRTQRPGDLHREWSREILELLVGASPVRKATPHAKALSCEWRRIGLNWKLNQRQTGRDDGFEPFHDLTWRASAARV